jgi:hypothetical protein
MARQRIGIWLFGARGGVATTAIVGLAALRRGLVGIEYIQSLGVDEHEFGRQFRMLERWTDRVTAAPR